MENNTNPPDPKLHWQNRRRLGWLSVLVIVLSGCYILYRTFSNQVDHNILEASSTLLMWWFTTWLGLAFSYFLGATITDIIKLKEGSK